MSPFPESFPDLARQIEQDELLRLIQRHPDLLLSLSPQEAHQRDLLALIEEIDQAGETNVMLPNGQTLRIISFSPGYQGVYRRFVEGQWSDSNQTIAFANRDQLLLFLTARASPET